MSYQQNNERINELARKWLSGTITPEEKIEFDKWYDEAGRTMPVSQPTADRAPEAPADADANALRERMFRAIAKREGLGGERIKVASPKSPREYVARKKTVIIKRALFAAATLIVLVIPAWLYHRQYATNADLALSGGNKSGQLTARGSNKATLTLSNGKTVLLEPADHRNISDNSGATIRQRDSGLVYSGESTAGPVADVSYNTLTIPRGGQYKIVLSDGTRVWLNSASSLRYPAVFSGGDREVTLSGEGYFEVAKDDDHPFRVNAGGQLIDVLGTEFNVNCYPDEADTRTTLLRGSVRVSLPGRSDSRVIEPGQQAILANADPNTANNHLRIAEPADLAPVVAWKNGYFQLDDADIHTIMRQVARWYDVDIVYEGEAPAQRLSGKMRRSASVQEFLDMLSYFNIHFRTQGKKITVMAGGGATTIHR